MRPFPPCMERADQQEEPVVSTQARLKRAAVRLTAPGISHEREPGTAGL